MKFSNSGYFLYYFSQGVQEVAQTGIKFYVTALSLVTVHDRNLVSAHQFPDTLSNDELKKFRFPLFL